MGREYETAEKWLKRLREEMARADRAREAVRAKEENPTIPLMRNHEQAALDWLIYMSDNPKRSNYGLGLMLMELQEGNLTLDHVGLDNRKLFHVIQYGADQFSA